MSAVTGQIAARPLPRPRRISPRALAGEQIAVAGGQLVAGLGNMAFALVLAHLLAPGAFADVAAFLALYLLIHVPAASLSAGSALEPATARRLRRSVLLAGVGVGAALALASIPLGAVLNIPFGLVLALAATAPAAGLLALERGRLYGTGRRGHAVASLVAEPLVRLTLGIALAVTLGPVGAAAGVVVAGWSALGVAALPGRSRSGEEAHAARDASRPALATVAAFLLLAVVQNQDVLLANALLSDSEAGRFAVLSTLGGMAAFATTTIPLVLLPRAAGGERGALRAALLVAAALGAAASLAMLVAPPGLVGAMFGERYAAIAPLAAAYVLAMGLLGVARVLVAHACAIGETAGSLVLLGVTAAAHAAALVVFGDDAQSVANTTLAATAVLTAAAGGAAVVRFPVGRTREARTLDLGRHKIAIGVAALTVLGLVLRLLATRSIWLDEAISIHQAHMPFAEMLANLRTTDVHPPLHHVVLWLTVHAFGDSELAVRAPSLVAGTALVPLLYLTGREIYDRRAGLAAAALGAVAPFAIWYSDEARMYSFFMLFALLAVLGQMRVLRRGRARDWALYAVATVALVYNQYFALFFVAAQQLGFLAAAVGRRREGRPILRLVLPWAGVLVLIGLALAPLVPFAHDQFVANESAGKGFQAVPSQAGAGAGAQTAAGPSLYGVITNFLWAMWGYHSNATMTQLAALWPLTILAALMLLGRGRSRATMLLLVCALLPVFALFALGQVKPFVFEVRYFIGTVPCLLLVFGRVVTGWAPSRAVAAVAATALASTLALGAADQQLNGTNPRLYDFEGALEQVSERARPGDVIVYTPQYLQHVVGYYAGGMRTEPIDGGLPKKRDGGRVFVLASFLDKPQFSSQAGDAVSKLTEERKLVDRFEVPQIKVWEFQ